MVAITSAFVLASLTVAAFAGRPFEGSFRARHEKRARSLHARDATYTLTSNYTGSDFMDESKWAYFTGEDPTNGMVDYLSLKDAKSAGLVNATNGVFSMSVEGGDLASGTYRKSVRISSVEQWKSGLIVADFKEMPYGCGVWPAFWTVGQSWPDDGELDIIENVNTASNNQLTFHSGETGSSCTLDTDPGMVNGVTGFLGSVLGTTCASSANSDAGCAFSDTDPNSFGAGFNAVGGRVMTVLRDENGVKIWSFARSSVPEDILTGQPNPALWSSPKAFWSSASCNFTEHMAAQTIVLNTDVAGGWTDGNIEAAGCGSDINSIVANGDNFAHASWGVNYIALYE